MKRSLKNIIYGCLAVAALVMTGCTEEIEPSIPSVPEDSPVETHGVTRLFIGLPGNTPDTKLNYELGAINGRKAIKTTWSRADVIAANASPSNKNYMYSFYLTDGEGTGIGTFECTYYPSGTAPENLNSNAWAMYFPGDRIQQESDFLNFSYDGQVQIGDNNMKHLKDYHTIRLLSYYSAEAVSTPFSDSFIDFSDDNTDESSCMKFNLSNLPSGIVPTQITLRYIGSDNSNVFHVYNDIPSYFGSVAPKNEYTNAVSLGLQGFGETRSLVAYMMLSCADVYVYAGGKFRVTVTAANGRKYYCDKPVNSDATLEGGKLHSITCSSWNEVDNIDGFNNPEQGIVVLQEATVGSGTDIVIMGDGFAGTDENFGNNGKYDEVMRQAYKDFFSMEPYATLKPYFNVYYIKAVSEDNHDAIPHNYGGAEQGSASTVFNTQFQVGSTSVSGNDQTVYDYMLHAIRSKGGPGGTPVTDEYEVSDRGWKGLGIVMVNVKCYAGTCWGYDSNGSNDYLDALSIAYTPLGDERYEDDCRLTTLHEAAGHGFGKLADEYGSGTFSTFDPALWEDIDSKHSIGRYRNADKYYTRSSSHTISGWPYTTSENVYWSELLNEAYPYIKDEGLGMYEGGKTYGELFCRPTNNSVMRHQFQENGQFFNAISRWAIWYRLMRLTNMTTATRFKDSLDEFIAFDSTLDIKMNNMATKGYDMSYENRIPLAPPVLVEGRLINRRLAETK